MARPPRWQFNSCSLAHIWAHFFLKPDGERPNGWSADSAVYSLGSWIEKIIYVGAGVYVLKLKRALRAPLVPGSSTQRLPAYGCILAQTTQEYTDEDWPTELEKGSAKAEYMSPVVLTGLLETVTYGIVINAGVTTAAYHEGEPPTVTLEYTPTDIPVKVVVFDAQNWANNLALPTPPLPT